MGKEMEKPEWADVEEREWRRRWKEGRDKVTSWKRANLACHVSRIHCRTSSHGKKVCYLYRKTSK
jgi:hypothetical protein